MPHQCTGCGHQFADGSKEMLSGCPECGGNKFQFIPGGASHTEPSGNVGDPEEPATAANPATAGGETVIDADVAEANQSTEDRAQASARSVIASETDLPTDSRAAGGAAPEVTGEEAPSEADPGLSELRKELNEQFESIKILQPGQYELNLMELYDREEYIIALKEDGRYVIEVPETWRE